MHVKEIVISKLREKGVKVTPQRLAILDYLERSHTHPSAEEIYSAIVKSYPAISVATVYNTLDMLVDLGQVIKLKIGEDRVNYEYNLMPHHHFYCKKCRRIYDIMVDCPIAKKTEVEGHKIEECHGYFKGVCQNCLES